MSETKTNFKNQLKLVASLILKFSLPFLGHYQNHLNAPDELDIFLKHRLLFPELIAILVIYGDRQKHPDIPDFPNIYIVPRFSKKTSTNLELSLYILNSTRSQQEHVCLSGSPAVTSVPRGTNKWPARQVGQGSCKDIIAFKAYS